MAQAFYTAIGGISAAQSQVNVIANNIANINTVGFKESNVSFADLYYNTISSGSAPSRNVGGTNPKQVGLGVQISSIRKNFEPGTVQATGNSTDMNIQGDGFFCVQDATGAIMYTRAGNFDFDSQGYLVNPEGYRVIGTNTVFGSQSGQSAVKIPTLIKTETVPNTTTILSKETTDLNGVEFTKGTMSMVASIDDGAGNITDYTIDIDISNAKNLQDVINSINTAIANTTGVPKDSIAASVKDGQFVINADKTSVQNIKFKAGTSNFFSNTELSAATRAADGSYSSIVLDSQQIISMPDVPAEGQSYKDVTVYESGALEITYANGDKLTVTLDEDTNKNIYRYTTKEGIIIEGADVQMGAGVCELENLQIQLAKFVNPNGLLAVGSNLFQLSANSGLPYYGFANAGGMGAINTGGLEASNVDLSKQFADMIQSQRAIEANSRVFSTTNEVLKTLVYMGQ